MVASYLRRGLAAGLLAGLLAGLFAFFFGEPSVDGAIQFEEAAATGHDHGEEVFSRSTQKVGLFFATGLSGVFVGGLFGMAYTYFGGRLASGSEWNRSLSLAGAAFVGAFLIPFVKYPATPRLSATRPPSGVAPPRTLRWSRSRCWWSWARGTRPGRSGSEEE